jgi:uncharacterized membrane protein YgaE (UPF0421/DUF939 family)
MSQSRAGSAFEALLNIAIGCGVAFLGNLVFLPLVGLQITAGQNLTLTFLFTGLSLVRSYSVRRLFNRLGI